MHGATMLSRRGRQEQAMAVSGRSRRGGTGRNWPWIGICIVVGVLGACGFRNDPVPVSTAIPPTEDQRARLREDRILISWRLPQQGLVRQRGAVRSYEAIVRHVPLACMDCRPEFDRRIVLTGTSPDLTVENQTLYYLWKPEGAPVQWLIQMQTHFQFGDSRVGSPVIVEGANDTPAHALSSEPVQGSRQVRLYWKPRQERLVHVVTSGGGHFERPVFYRANVYRRFPPAPWPFTPLNGAPLDAVEYLVQPPVSRSKGGPDRVEYTIRLVDRFGNEGPAAPPVEFESAPGETG
jgi:hypothetical protein